MKLEIELTKGQREALTWLVNSGFYGTSIEAAAIELMNEGLRRRILPEGKGMSVHPLDTKITLSAR